MLQGLIRFIEIYHTLLLFLALEIIAFTLFINRHSYQRSSFLNSSNQVTSGIYDAYHNVDQYLSLSSANKALVAENLRLHQAIADQKLNNKTNLTNHGDYLYYHGRVINQSTHRRENYLTLNLGKLDGVRPDMGVFSPEGVVGVTYSVSDHYSIVVSLLNEQFRLSSKIAKNGYFGSLIWDTGFYEEASLHEIPTHVDIAIGDTIVTSGYSAIFPEGMLVGRIEEVNTPPGSNFYDIKVKLAVNFKNTDHVYVIDNKHQAEAYELKSEVEND